MEAQADMKVCPACAESINTAAKVCPFCRSKQHRFALLGRELAGVAVVVILCCVPAVVLSLLFPNDISKGRSFGMHRLNLEVRVDRFLHQARIIGQTTNFVSVDAGQLSTNYTDHFVGIVTNHGGIPWRVQEFEIQFLDSNGKLADVVYERVHEPFVVQPRSEHAFRLELSTSVVEHGKTAKFRVSRALDGTVAQEPE